MAEDKETVHMRKWTNQMLRARVLLGLCILVAIGTDRHFSSDHRWFSELQPELTGKGWRVLFKARPDGQLLQGVMFAEQVAQTRGPTKNCILTMDFCVTHGEVKVLNYRPPENETRDAGAREAGANEHQWYSQVEPQITGAGLRLIIPIKPTRANWGGVIPEKVAAANPAVATYTLMPRARFTVDICLLHGEVKVISYTLIER